MLDTELEQSLLSANRPDRILFAIQKLGFADARSLAKLFFKFKFGKNHPVAKLNFEELTILINVGIEVGQGQLHLRASERSGTHFAFRLSKFQTVLFLEIPHVTFFVVTAKTYDWPMPIKSDEISSAWFRVTPKHQPNHASINNGQRTS